MKSLLGYTLVLVLSVTLLLAIKSKRQPTPGAQIRIVTSAGAALRSLFEGISPTLFGRRAVQPNGAEAESRREMPRMGLCKSEKRGHALWQEGLDGGKLTASCYMDPNCTGHYVVIIPASYCLARCSTNAYMVDIDSGDPNKGEQENDVDCFGTCCTNYQNCGNPCEPDECF
jgi:hypothetical protein